MAGESVEAPIVAGGDRVSIEIDLRRSGGSAKAAEIVVRSGLHDLGTWPLAVEKGWQTIAIEPTTWPAAAKNLSFEIRVRETSRPALKVILDRARFSWQ